MLVKMLISAVLCICLGNGHQVLCQQADSNPPVVEAVIPVFPATAIATAQEGQVLLLVMVRNDGKVKSVEFKSGPSIFRPVAKLVASRWKFAPTKSSTTCSVQLSFIFKLMPDETKSEDMLPVYRPPYEVEVRAKLPSVSKDAGQDQN